MTHRKPVIGLIGGIGAGKSLAASLLAGRGGAIVDADKLGHEALEVPAVKEKLIARWGRDILKPDGTANRRAIAAIVFNNPAELRALESLVYPVIGKRAQDAVVKHQADSGARFVVLDAAVMLEAGWNGVCDRLLYVDVPRELRIARLAARSGWNAAEVAAREAAQMPTEEKKARADAVVVNDSTPERLKDQIDRVLTGWGL